MGLFSSSSDKVNVIAHLRAKAGSEAAVRAILVSVVKTSLKESGCKEYRLHEDTREPGSFYTFEEWASSAQLDKHLEAAKAMLEQTRPLLEGDLELTILKPVTE